MHFIDGDQLTYASVKNPKFHIHFLTFCSSYAFIDRSTGYFNRAMGFEREYAAILSVLWDIGKVIDNYVTNPTEETFTALTESGIESPLLRAASPSEEGVFDWDGTGLDPIFKIPFDPDSVDANVHYLASMFS